MMFQILETKMTELDTVHSAYNQLLFESDAEKADYERARVGRRVQDTVFDGENEDIEDNVVSIGKHIANIFR